ncbi:MAG: hypothetical protein QG641_979 [Candidatus Poribacteria bacterium]|nr:hypothetical protein [Candidatus Poribacteria bacterium]
MRVWRLSIIGLMVFGMTLATTGIVGAKELPGLVVYFSFDEGKGNVVSDRSGTGNSGSLKGGAKWAAGQYGGGVTFDGKDGVVEVENSDSLQFTDGLTLAAWIKPTLKGDEWQLIGSKGLDAKEYFELLLSPQGFLWLGWLFNGGRVVPAQSPAKIKADEWQHVAVSWDPAKFWNIYLNGEVLIEHPKQNDKLVPNTDPILIGTEKDMKRFYSGVMDDWALFNKGLTQDEIKQIMAGIQNLLPVNETKAKLTSTWGRIKG